MQPVTKNDKKKAEAWKIRATMALNTSCIGATYVPVVQKVMVGIYIIMIAKKEIVKDLSHIKKESVKTGFSGIAGNKGSVAVSFNYNDTSFAFINTHMEAGQKSVAERLENVRQIYNETFHEFKNNEGTHSSGKHDYFALFGDTNFRIDLPNEELRQLIKEKNYERMREYD